MTATQNTEKAVLDATYPLVCAGCSQKVVEGKYVLAARNGRRRLIFGKPREFGYAYCDTCVEKIKIADGLTGEAVA